MVKSFAAHRGPFFRYTIVGTVAFAVDLALLLALLPHMPLLLANTLAFLTANIANFILGHVWVFRRSLTTAFGQYAQVFLISVVGLILNDLVVWMGVEVISLSTVVAKIIATGVALCWNYLARVVWVYRE